MMSQTKHVTTLERHCLLMPFEYLRCCNHKLNSSLVYSMEQYGQLMPVIAIPTPNQECSWTLIDGHSRLRALKQLDKELVTVEIWDCSPTEALVNIIKYNSSRPLALIEEALLIKELHVQYELTQGQLAEKLGKNKSWVSRRLALIEFLPELLLQSLIKAKISPWIATRILSPLARANLNHAKILLGYLESKPNSTREVATFYQHYTKANYKARENMINEPELFFKMLRLQQQDIHAAKLKDGVEGEWKHKLKLVNNLITELSILMPKVFLPSLEAIMHKNFKQIFIEAKHKFDQLLLEIQKIENA